jgi:hypothetical protein
VYASDNGLNKDVMQERDVCTQLARCAHPSSDHFNVLLSHSRDDVLKGCLLPIGLMLPDARMTKLAATTATAAAFSLRFANADDDVEWVAIEGSGAVNVIGNVTVIV